MTKENDQYIEMIKNKCNFEFITKEIKKRKFKLDEDAIHIIAFIWKRNYKNQENIDNKHLKIELFKTLISHGAKFNEATKIILKVNTVMDNDEINEIDKFHKQYNKFLNLNLKKYCFNYFKKENINIQDLNIIEDLKTDFISYKTLS